MDVASFHIAASSDTFNVVFRVVGVSQALFHKDTGLDVPQKVSLSCHGLAQAASPF